MKVLIAMRVIRANRVSPGDFGQVYPDSHAERHPDNHGDCDKDRCAQQGRGDAASRFADSSRLLDEEIPVDRADSMNHEIAEDREKRAKSYQSRDSRSSRSPRCRAIFARHSDWDRR